MSGEDGTGPLAQGQKPDGESARASVSVAILGSAGQAATGFAMMCGKTVHRVAQFALALVIMAAVAVVSLAVRLSEGPLQLDWLARRMTAMANAGGGPETLTIATVALAWEGWGGGIDQPLDLLVTGARLSDAAGNRIAEVPRAAISLSATALLRGSLALRAVEIDGARLRVRRMADGTTTVDLGTLSDEADAKPAPGTPPALADIVRSLAAAPLKGGGRWSELRRLRLRDAAVVVMDDQLGVTWRAPTANLDLVRAARGGASGTGNLTLALGGQVVRAEVLLALLPGGQGIAVSGSLSPFVPARLASIAPALAPLAALDASLALTGTLELDAALGLRLATLHATAQEGMVHAGADGVMPIRQAALSAELRPDGLSASLDRLVLQARPEAAPTTITGTIAGRRDHGMLLGDITTDLDQVLFEDLPALWPKGVGGPGTRPWITRNITAGRFEHGHVALSVELAEDLSDGRVTHIEGGGDGHDITGHWLRPVPPIEHADATVSFVDPDTLDARVTSGVQSGTHLAVKSAHVRLTGLAGHDQFVAIDSQLGGPVADGIALLKHPKIHLLDRRPIDIRNPQGQLTTRLTVSLPLKNDLDIDNVAIHAVGRMTGLHAGGTAAGRDIDRGAFDFDVDNNGLKLGGSADIAGITSQIQAALDFRAGPQSQVLTRLSLSAAPDARQIATAGLDLRGIMTGTAAVAVSLVQRRDGGGELSVKADLMRSAIDGGRLRWSKPRGQPATIDAALTLAKDRPVALTALRAEARDLSVSASAEMTDGRPSLLRIAKLQIGEGTKLSGTVRMPPAAGKQYQVVLNGDSIDLSGEFDRHAPTAAGPTPQAPDQRGPAFTADVRLGQVVLSPGHAITGVSATIDNDGLLTRTARLAGTAGDGAFLLSLTPIPVGRRLEGHAADAGGLLRALDVMQDISGGRITLSGVYDDTKPGHPLSGIADIQSLRLANAPGIARLLQGLSVYGLLEVAEGPGLGIDRLLAPFTLRDQILTLSDARAFSASLGMTAKGTMDLNRRVAEIEGTVVPVYALNAALGRIPLIGRLFSPEAGGGLFALAYSIRGPFDDPTVLVNPLSAITPGFLRGFFDMFDAQTGPAAPPAPDRPRQN